MLLRRYHDLLRGAVADGADRFPGDVLQRLEGAARFRFTPLATEAAAQIAGSAGSLEAARTQIFAPFPDLWMDFDRDGRAPPVAVHWQPGPAGGDGLRSGYAVVIEWPAAVEYPRLIPVFVDLDRDDFVRIPHEAQATLREAPPPGMEALDVDATLRNLPKIGRMLLAAFALLATKGMTETVVPDLSKLNKARGRKGLYPLLAFTEIRLNLDAERAVRAKHATGTGAMPLHPVRAHLRLLPTGKVVIVRAHMRGNPEHGVRGHHYTVLRDEDAAAR